MRKATPAETAAPQQTKPNGASKPAAGKPGRAISDPKEVAQLVMMRIDHVNAQKDELTTAVKALADTAKQLVSGWENWRRTMRKVDVMRTSLESALGS